MSDEMDDVRPFQQMILQLLQGHMFHYSQEKLLTFEQSLQRLVQFCFFAPHVQWLQSARTGDRAEQPNGDTRAQWRWYLSGNDTANNGRAR